jgi:hypothetical protein
MASEDTFIGNDFVVQIESLTSSGNFQDICAAVDFGSVGEEKPLVDVTGYCDTARTYRNGLADGVEIPLQCNFIPGDSTLESMYDSYQSDQVRNFRIAYKDGSPTNYFQFSATIRAWNITGPIGEKSVMQFTLKISGAVTWNR